MLKENLNPISYLLENNSNKFNNEDININDDKQALDKSFSDKISERLSEIKSVFKRERLGFLYCVLAQFVWTSNDVYLKFITKIIMKGLKIEHFYSLGDYLFVSYLISLGNILMEKYILYLNFLLK